MSEPSDGNTEIEGYDPGGLQADGSWKGNNAFELLDAVTSSDHAAHQPPGVLG